MTPSINTIFWEFFKIGATVFGGPYPQAAVMEERFVSAFAEASADTRRSASARRRVKNLGWLDARQFQEGFGLSQALPGPIGPQVALYIGYCVQGRRGALSAIAGFVLPSFLMVMGLSVLYQHYGLIPDLNRFFNGLKPAILILLLTAGWRLGQTSWKFPLGRFALLGGFLACVLHLDPLWILIAAGGAGWILTYTPSSSPPTLLSLSPLLPLVIIFLKAGALLYGGGWAIIPLLEHDVVERYHWMTHQTFLDGMAIGQMTPGPIAMTATFIGYYVQGWIGACLATFCVFFPSVIFILIGTPLLLKWKDHPKVKPMIDAVVAAATGLILGEAFRLIPASFPHIYAWILGIFSAIAMWKQRWDPTLVMLGGGLIGWILFP